MQPIEIQDLYEYRFLSETTLSPDGSHLAFVVTRPHRERDGYHSTLWAMDTHTGRCRPLTAHGDESKFLWLDGETLLFPSKRGEAKQDGTTYYRLSLRGGEAQEAFTIPYPVSRLTKIGDDLFLAVVRTPCQQPQDRPDRARLGEEYLIFDELPFWQNGQGVVNKLRDRGVLFTPSTGECREFTGKYFALGGTALSPDHTRLLYWGSEYDSVAPRFTGLYEYHLGSGATVELLPPNRLRVNFAQYFGDRLLLEASPLDRNSSQSPQLYRLDARDGSLELWTDLDCSLGGATSTDLAYGGGATRRMVGDTLYATRICKGVTQLIALRPGGGGKVELLGQLDGIQCFDLWEDTCYCAGFDQNRPQELYAISVKTGESRRLTDLNRVIAQERQASAPQHLTFQNRAGLTLEGWVIPPVGYRPEEKGSYPGVLEIHGGPKVAFGGLHHHQMQCMAGRGMFVFYMNPRGSDGRGDEFSTLAGKLGTIDYEDLMDFTDHVLDRYPQLDRERLGVSGGSYGGFMTNWIIGHTQRFRAACAQRCISNYVTKCLTTDIGYYHNLSQVGADPWTDEEKMWWHSPLRYAGQVTTPTLFIQSDEDYRCWVSEPLQMFTALRLRGIDSRLALFHGENHSLSRTGRPSNRVSRLEEMCAWFERYLKG